MKAGQLKQYQVIGRKVPTEVDPTPKIFRMKIFAANHVVAKSRFWYFLHKMHKLKKTTGEIISVNEIFEKRPLNIKNFAVWVRYESRTGTHNMYKEYRELTLNDAVNACYQEMAARHRVRAPRLQIIRTAEVEASKCRRVNTTQFHDSKIKFPLPHRVLRTSSMRSKFQASRPNTFLG